MRPRAGMSLIELIVALTVLAFGILGLVGAASVAHRAFAGADATENAAHLAALVIDSLMTELLPAAGERAAGMARIAWTIEPLDAATPLLSRVSLDVHVIDAGRRRTVSYHAVHNAGLLR